MYRNTMKPTYANSPYKASGIVSGLHGQVDTLGLGKDAPMYSSVNTDSMELFQPSTKQVHQLRVPYPLSFFGAFRDGACGQPECRLERERVLVQLLHLRVVAHRGWQGIAAESVEFQMRPTRLPNSSCKNTMPARRSASGHRSRAMRTCTIR